MYYIAHIRDDNEKVEQSLKDHLQETQKIAETLGSKLGIKHLAGLSAVLHDIGKATEEFATYLHNAVYHPEKASRRGEVDHSAAGGKLLYEMFHQEDNDSFEQLTAEIVGNAIISHHGYLNDYVDLDGNSPYLKRVREKFLPSYEQAKIYFFKEVMSREEFVDYVTKAVEEFKSFFKNIPHSKGEQRDFYTATTYLTKVLFSILIDSDRTNTRLFEENKELSPTFETAKLFQKYYDRLMERLSLFEQEEQTPITQLRNQMSEMCESFAKKPSDIYTLSIPTGGGKTLSSFRYALKHALLHKKKRIIYVVPFNSITEQNAEVIREVIEDDENLLEHHSNVMLFDEKDSEATELDEKNRVKQKLLLAQDNYDVPIIFTSMVQFLNIFYSKGTRNIRRFHNLSDAVIIIDEVQQVPLHCVSLFNLALNYLKNQMNASILLCTATQPALDYVEDELEIATQGEIISNLADVSEAFKRVEIIDCTREGQQIVDMDTVELADLVSDNNKKFKSQLIILNTKKVVRDLYLELESRDLSDTKIYHLSTSMCGAHRNKFLTEIREELKALNVNDFQQPNIICVSTPLIEAGVDISFESVIRSLTGLDSIAQAAGRCNRNGERKLGKVFLVDHKEEKLTKLPEISDGKKETRKILADMQLNPSLYGGDLLSSSAVNVYFKNYYKEKEVMLQGNILNGRTTHIKLLTANRTNNEQVERYMNSHPEGYPLGFATSMRISAKEFEVISDYTTSVIVPYDEKSENIIADLNSSQKIEDYSRLFKEAQPYSISIYDQERDALEKSGSLISYCEGMFLSVSEDCYDKKYGLQIEGMVEQSALIV